MCFISQKRFLKKKKIRKNSQRRNKHIQTGCEMKRISEKKRKKKMKIGSYISFSTQTKKRRTEIILVLDSWCWATALCTNQSHKATPLTTSYSISSYFWYALFFISFSVYIMLYIYGVEYYSIPWIHETQRGAP